MPRKSTEATGENPSPETDLQDENAYKDLLVSEDDLKRHTADADSSVTHDQVRDALSKIQGNLADDIRDERDQG